MVNVKCDITLAVSESNADVISELKTIDLDVDNTRRETIIVADETVDKEYAFTDLGKIEFLYLVASQEISIKPDLNTNTAITGKVFMFSGTSIESIFISNDSGSSANIRVIAGG